VSASTDINADKIAEFFVKHRLVFAIMHLRNFCQVSIEEVRQVMTGSAVKIFALDRNSEGRRLKIGIGVTHPL